MEAVHRRLLNGRRLVAACKLRRRGNPPSNDRGCPWGRRRHVRSARRSEQIYRRCHRCCRRIRRQERRFPDRRSAENDRRPLRCNHRSARCRIHQTDILHYRDKAPFDRRGPRRQCPRQTWPRRRRCCRFSHRNRKPDRRSTGTPADEACIVPRRYSRLVGAHNSACPHNPRCSYTRRRRDGRR